MAMVQVRDDSILYGEVFGGRANKILSMEWQKKERRTKDDSWVFVLNKWRPLLSWEAWENAGWENEDRVRI